MIRALAVLNARQPVGDVVPPGRCTDEEAQRRKGEQGVETAVKVDRVNAAAAEKVVHRPGEEEGEVDDRYQRDRNTVADEAAHGCAEQANDHGHEHEPPVRFAVPPPDPAEDEEAGEAEDIDEADEKGYFGTDEARAVPEPHGGKGHEQAEHDHARTQSCPEQAKAAVECRPADGDERRLHDEVENPG